MQNFEGILNAFGEKMVKYWSMRKSIKKVSRLGWSMYKPTSHNIVFFPYCLGKVTKNIAKNLDF